MISEVQGEPFKYFPALKNVSTEKKDSLIGQMPWRWQKESDS